MIDEAEKSPAVGCGVQTMDVSIGGGDSVRSASRAVSVCIKDGDSLGYAGVKSRPESVHCRTAVEWRSDRAARRVCPLRKSPPDELPTTAILGRSRASDEID